MAFALEGFSTVAQNYISRGIASNFYSKSPLLAVLGALTLGNQKKNSLEIGRPNSAEILAGKNLSIAEKKMLQGINSYCPRIQLYETSNTKAMSARDTMPTVANPTTASHGQAMQAAAKFNWCHIKTPCLIWHEDKIRASQQGTKEGQGLAMSQLIDEATEVALQDQISWLATQLWEGSPADQTADLWSEPCGLSTVLSASNTYGNIDRSVSGNAVWRAQVDSTLKAIDITRILDNAALDKSLNIKGNGANLVLTTSALYKAFKAQIAASGGVVLGNGLPEFAKMGFRKEILQKDNVYIAYDPGCPANNVAVLTLDTFKFMLHPQQNFRVGKFVDISEQSEGAKDADQAFVHTRFIFSCDNPYLNVLYSAIGT